jgi:hypothetical protein
VTDAGFAIRRFEFARHGFETEARGRFEADAAGTRITVGFGFRRADLCFILLWILLASLAGGILLLALGGRPAPGSMEGAFPVWMPALMVAVLTVVYAARRWSSRGDTAMLVRLLRGTLDANEAQEPVPIE